MVNRLYYSGKPLAYLDHNILDLLGKYDLPDFLEILSEYQIVYSDVTLKEIRRSIGSEEMFLRTLDRMGALHIAVNFDFPHFKSTNEIIIHDVTPLFAYEHYCKNQDSGPDTNVYNALAIKLWGGKKDLSFQDIFIRQLKTLNDSLDMTLEDLTPDHENLRPQMDVIINSVKVQSFLAWSKAYEAMQQQEQEGQDLVAAHAFRHAVNVLPKQLNNVEPPNVIEQIWEMLTSSEKFSGTQLTIDDFFTMESFSEAPLHCHQKVTRMYNTLNLVGYHQDTDLNKDNRFIASMDDCTHAEMASFCHALFSNDKKFLKKAKAIYEYLGIATTIFTIEIEKTIEND